MCDDGLLVVECRTLKYIFMVIIFYNDIVYWYGYLSFYN